MGGSLCPRPMWSPVPSAVFVNKVVTWGVVGLEPGGVGSCQQAVPLGCTGWPPPGPADSLYSSKSPVRECRGLGLMPPSGALFYPPPQMLPFMGDNSPVTVRRWTAVGSKTVCMGSTSGHTNVTVHVTPSIVPGMWQRSPIEVRPTIATTSRPVVPEGVCGELWFVVHVVPSMWTLSHFPGVWVSSGMSIPGDQVSHSPSTLWQCGRGPVECPGS